jgi:hypothetical protein
MARRGWDTLSTGYRDRLQRSGVTREGYERGESIQKARGHESTPEHGLKDAVKNPAKFREYLDVRRERQEREQPERLERLRNQAYQHARQAEISDLSAYGSNFAIEENIENACIEELEAMLKASPKTWSQRAKQQPKDYGFEGRINPWWYHGELGGI